MKKEVKKYLKIAISLILGLLIIYEGSNMFVDFYNFRQLEKVKVILKDVKKENLGEMYSIKKFNEIYNSDLKSIKNYYYINSYNTYENRVPYIFGFKLESLIYILR